MGERSVRKMFVLDEGDTATWPELRLTFYPLPWTWRFTKLHWFDDVTYSFTLRFGPFGIEMWSN